jgi:hypothetical protein
VNNSQTPYVFGDKVLISTAGTGLGFGGQKIRIAKIMCPVFGINGVMIGYRVQVGHREIPISPDRILRMHKRR